MGASMIDVEHRHATMTTDPMTAARHRLAAKTATHHRLATATAARHRLATATAAHHRLATATAARLRLATTTVVHNSAMMITPRLAKIIAAHLRHVAEPAWTAAR